MRITMAASTLAFLSSLFLTAATGAADDAVMEPGPVLSDRRAGEFSIFRPKPVNLEMPDRRRLMEICRTERPVEACTLFGDERLTCKCLRTTVGWSIHAAASLVPISYLLRPQLAMHELLHIEDVESALKRYLEQLVGTAFQTRIECEQAARSETLQFTDLMNDFRRKSNALYH